MNAYTFYPDNRVRDFKPGDKVEYGINWKEGDAEGFRTGHGEVVEVGKALIKVLVSIPDAKYMDLPDRMCLMVPYRLRKIA